MKTFRAVLTTVLVIVGLITGSSPGQAHAGCNRWPHSSGVLWLQHYVGYFDFGSYPEYRDAINDWNQPATPIDFYDGGTPQSYQVKSVSSSYPDSWPGYAIVYNSFCSISEAVVLINTRVMVNYTYSDRRHVECQELGHTLGLDHNSSDASCMNDGTYYQYYISSHDISDSNAMYPR